MPPGIPNGLLYAPVREGGLGLPALRTMIPRLRYRRLKKLVSSHHATISWTMSSTHGQKDLALTETLTWVKGTEVKTKEQEAKYWSCKLHATFDGAHLSGAKLTPSAHGWVRGMPYLSGKEFILLLKMRVNALPTRARMARGRPHMERACRKGCAQPETLNHILQQCPYTKHHRIKRHHDAVSRVAKALESKGYSVHKEFKVFIDGTVSHLRPDIVAIINDTVWVLDVEINGTERDLNVARQAKIEKYSDPVMLRSLPRSELPRRVGTIQLTYTGVWNRASYEELLLLGVPKKTLKDLTVNVGQGSLRIYRAYQSSDR